jgi:iron complex outermembrane recepter protein
MRVKLLVACTLGVTTAHAQEAADKNSVVIDQVIVSAQRRVERLQDVPISITVLGGTDLDKSTASGVGETLNRVPGLMLDPGAGGGAVGGGMQLASRGVSAPSSFAAGPSPVAYYMDGVPFGLVRSSAVPDGNVYDLERVEVLRGPQGTLYGANAGAGVVRILTHDPALDAFEFKSRALFSQTENGGNNGQVDLALNAPIVANKLAARAVVGYQDMAGWIDKATRRDANDTEQVNARLKVLAQPTEELTVGLSGWMSRSEQGALAIATDGRGEASGVADVEGVDADFDIYGLKIGYDFPAFSVTSNSSYIDYVSENDFSQNAARTDSFVFTKLTAYVFAEEISIVSNLEGPWRWTAGAMYRDGLDRQYQEVSGFAFPASIKYTSESWAVFAELTRELFDGRLELTAGARYFEDTVGQVHEANASNAPPPAGTAPPAEDKFDSTTPRVILNWHPSDQTTLYASYSEGFRSGLQQNPVIRVAVPSIPTTKPDLLKNYEVGTKGSLAGGRFSYDIAAYYMDWQDVQLPLTLTVQGIGRSLLVNGASASGPGVDVSLSTQPIDGLLLGVNASWNDLKVDEDVFSSNVLLFEKGDRLNASVETTAGASVSYNFPFGSGGYEGTFAASGSYRTKLSNRAVAGTSVTVTTSDPILIGRAAFTLHSPGRWDATLFADNINNEQDVTFRAQSLVPGLISAYYPRPRTIGLQLEYRFD